MNYYILEDVYVSPANSALYDNQGKIIKNSALIRGHNKERAGNAPVYIDISKITKQINEPVIYCGDVSKVWGHFLTECSSRLWFLIKYPEYNLKKVYCSDHKEHVKATLKIADLGLESLQEPTYLKKCILPKAAFRQRCDCHPDHSLFHEHVANKLGPYKSNGKILYLSRRKLSNDRRHVKGEKEIEDFIKELGGDVIYPEQETVPKQIKLINTYSTIIGCVGSALHTILFRVNSDPYKLINICPPHINKNYYLIDQVKGLDTIYLYNGLNIDGRSKKKKSRQDMIVDMDVIKKKIHDRL